MRRIDWDTQPLGRVKDAAIAAELGVSDSTVREQRRKRGIPSAYRPGSRRTGELRALVLTRRDELGRRSDTDIGAELGIRRQAVTQVRMELGIPAYPKGGPSKARRDIPREAFDGRTTEEIAAEYGCCLSTVRNRRDEYGIAPPPRGARERHDWGSVDWSQTNRQIAAQLGALPGSVARKRRTAAPPEHRIG